MRAPAATRAPRTRATPARAIARRVEAWLWTGPLGHLAGGSLDVGEALLRGALAPRLRRMRRRRS